VIFFTRVVVVFVSIEYIKYMLIVARDSGLIFERR